MIYLNYKRLLSNSSNPFIISVKTDNAGTSASNQFTIRTNGIYTYDYTVKIVGQTFTGTTGDLTITFPSAGTYDVEIRGTFPTIYFNNSGDKSKVLELKAFGNIQWQSFFRSFYGCNNLSAVSALDAPKDFTDPNVSFFNAFRGCTSLATFNGIENWDMAGYGNNGVTNIVTMFSQCTSLTYLNIKDWDVTKIIYANQFLGSVTLTTPNYDEILISWAAQSVNSGVSISFGNSKYTLGGAAEAARTTLITTYGWTISDGGGI